MWSGKSYFGILEEALNHAVGFDIGLMEPKLSEVSQSIRKLVTFLHLMFLNIDLVVKVTSWRAETGPSWCVDFSLVVIFLSKAKCLE